MSERLKGEALERLELGAAGAGGEELKPLKEVRAEWSDST